MAAKIGILGENTAVAVATVTVYTVPANKAARVRILFAAEGGVGSNYGIFVGTPGTELTIHIDDAANRDTMSGSIPEGTPDPASSIVSRASGVQKGVGIFDLDSGTFDNPWLLTPLSADYYLSTGDTVRYAIGNNVLTDHLIQVIGVEDDV